MTADHSTHRLGVRCTECGAAVEFDDCCPGHPHGCTWQDPSPWAAQTWPDHPCFNGRCNDCGEPATVLLPHRARRGQSTHTFHTPYCADCARRWDLEKRISQGDE